MRFFVKNGSTTSGFYRAWLGTRAEYDTAIVNLTNVGSGTAFSILPTYRKVAIWFRTN